MKRFASDVLGLQRFMETDGYAVYAMANGTLLELCTPQGVPKYGYNDGIAFGYRIDDIEAASQELAAAGYELLGDIVRIEDMRYAHRHFRGPDGRVYGLNEQE